MTNEDYFIGSLDFNRHWGRGAPMPHLGD